MKRRFTILTAALALLAFLTIPMGMRGQTRDVETFTFSELGYGNAEDVTTVVGDDVTLTFDAGTNASNSPKYYNTGSGVRMYTGNTLEVALNNQTSNTRITAIDFTFSGSSYTGGLQNWTGSETSHTFTATGTARIQVIAVTFSEGGTAPTTYTVTYYANVAGTAPVVDTYAEGADVTLRAANTFTNEGYTFSEWNTQADGDGDPYDAGGVIENIQDDIELYAIWMENAPSDDHWVLTSLADLTTSDVFVIVGNNGSNYAMSNNGGTTDAPSAVAVTVTGNEITSNVAATIQWTISGNATDGYTFYPNGSTSTWLYCTATNNGVRVGTNTNKTFVIDATSGYLKHNGTSRYVGIYNSSDWRCYTSAGGNIANQTFAFYKKVTGSVPPSITANNVSIAYDATSGEIEYTLNNPAANGSLSVSDNVDWISNAAVNTTESKVTFTTTANEATTAREGIITITYTYNRETISKDVTVTQAAAPVIYTTIPALFAAATGTETSVLVTFNNWVVSGVSTNGKNVFVTDNNGNGFVIFDNNGGLGNTYTVGDILAGTAVSCDLKKYNGFAELLNVNANDLTITNGGTVTVANVAMADLAGVNTGALLHYGNLTCSVDDNKYYLSDGTTTLQVYNSLFTFDALEDGKTYNITGIYQQYNSTKEILPRSAADIEEVVMASVTVTPNTINAPAEGADGTLALAYENIPDLNSFDYYFCNANGDELLDTDPSYPDWIEAAIQEENDVYSVDYTINANEGEARTAYFKVYTMDTPNQEEVYAIVTVNQAAPVAPVTGDKYVKVTSTADLTSGQYLIVYEEGSVAFDGSLETLDVEGNTIEVTINDSEIGIDNITIASEFTIDMTAGTIMSASGYYIGQTSNANGMQTSLETAYTNTISFDESGNANIVSSGGAYLRYNSASNQNRFRYYKSSSYTGQKAIQLYKKVYNLDITGYGTSAGGYYLIASPVTVNPADVEGMTEGHFDLFRFNESADYEWENWKVEGDHYHFNLVPGQGYLYAHKTDVTLTFTGTPYNGEPIILSKTDGDGIDWPGWNLVGNPYGVMAYLDRDFYTMNDAGDEIVAATNNSVQVMEGVFVIANFDGEELTFSTEAPAGSGEKIVVNVSNTNGKLLDRAMIRFGEGGQLPKFQINENSTKLYINEGEEEFAVVRCINESSTPVSFRPAENGTYTLSINTENVEMEYLHLIDNLTGADIDLLATPSYTFESNTTDNADRFAVVYTATTSVNENNAKPFAFFNGSEWVIMNEGNATMQVVDVTGRVISTETLNGNATINLIQVPGVYMFRLVNGNDVKVQKVVVK